MSERKFSSSGGRRRGQRFKPSPAAPGSGNNPKARRRAQNARALAKGEKSAEERVFAGNREAEIVRSENVAAGLPPEGAPKPKPKQQPKPAATATTAKSFEPVELKEKPKNLVDKIKKTAGKVIKKVKRMMNEGPKIHKEVIINYESLETRVAVLENGKLEEFNIERSNMERMAGSIYKGRIKNLEDGLKAAFVDIGFEKNAFLHYCDIVPSNLDSSVEVVERDGQKKRRGRRERPKVTQKDIPKLYPKGTEIIIQVSKGPIGTKGPRVTTHLALPGRYLVLLPNSDQCGISRKIDDPEERKRLKEIVRSLDIPEGMGVIIRTVGEGQQKRYFVRDLALLLKQWSEIQERIDKQPAATCVFQEPELVERTVRDFLTEDVERIVIDDHPKFEEVQKMIGSISKRSIDKVKFYHESQPIFDRFGIQRQLHNAFSRKVNLKSGGYLVIDETEALVAIDINTGSHKGKDNEKDKTIFRVNEEAADEVCRLLRLRNLGGLIIIDFIDMRQQRDQRAIFNRMRDNLKRDRAKTHILPISQLGLMEMTRQRHTESVQTNIYDDCQYCNGRGLVKNAMTMSVEVQRRLTTILKKRSRDENDFQLRIVVHPVVMERLRKEDEQILIDMEKKYFGKLTFRSDPTFHAEQFKIVNALTEAELAAVGF